jgi:tetratricopeptide (TPR) repeat protein
MGLWYSNAGNRAAALGHLDRAIEINPGLTQAHHWRSIVLAHDGRILEAISVSQLVAELDPLFWPAHGNMAGFNCIAGNYAAATRHAQQLRRTYRQPVRAAQQRGFCLVLQGRLAESLAELDSATAPGDRQIRVMQEFAYAALGEYERAVQVSIGLTEAPARIALGGIDEGIRRGRVLLVEAPERQLAAFGLLRGLSLAGRHAELLQWVSEEWGDAAGLSAELSKFWFGGLELAPLVAAQRAEGRDAEFATTMAHWSALLESLEQNGYDNSWFRATQAAQLALAEDHEAAIARLTAAVDAGHRDPLLDRWPEFATLHGNPRFRALVERMTMLIDIERAKLGLKPLS